MYLGNVTTQHGTILFFTSVKRWILKLVFKPVFNVFHQLKILFRMHVCGWYQLIAPAKLSTNRRHILSFSSSNLPVLLNIHKHYLSSQTLKVDMPILTCIFFTLNWLTLTSEMHFVKFHPVVASCLLSRGKRKYAPLGMRLLWKYIRNYFLVYQLISPFLVYLQNYKEFEAEISDLQSEKYGLSFDDIKKYTTSGWALGDEVIGIRAFNQLHRTLHWLSLQLLGLRDWLEKSIND